MRRGSTQISSLAFLILSLFHIHSVCPNDPIKMNLFNYKLHSTSRQNRDELCIYDYLTGKYAVGKGHVTQQSQHYLAAILPIPLSK